MSTSRKVFPIAAITFAGLAVLSVVGFAIYHAALRKGYVPNFPPVEISSTEAERILKNTAARILEFRPNDDEAELIARLEEIHLLETGEEIEVPVASVERRLEDFRRSLSSAASKDTPRALLLGDYLAFRFQKSLEAFLTTPPAENENRSGEMMRLILTGGAFYGQAVKNKLINPNRTLNCSKALPSILFRYRWRILAGLDGTAGFSDLEQKLLFDFAVRFVGPDEVERRIAAVKGLSKLVPDYDVETAEALVLYEGKRMKDALRVLDAAVRRGRDDAVVENFRRAVSQSM